METNTTEKSIFFCRFPDFWLKKINARFLISNNETKLNVKIVTQKPLIVLPQAMACKVPAREQNDNFDGD